MRNRSIDIVKGMAILLVYLDHSIIYHPIDLKTIYPWCMQLWDFITSFNMPLFFIISGFLFSRSKRDSLSLLNSKILRLAIPYLFTMLIVELGKYLLPGSMAKNEMGGGIFDVLDNVLLHGGDRWFVYVLFVMTIIVIPMRNLLHDVWARCCVYLICICGTLISCIPGFFSLSTVVRFLPFFILGYALNHYYKNIYTFCVKSANFPAILAVFIILNIVLVEYLKQIDFIWSWILPLSGSIAFLTIAWKVDKTHEKTEGFFLKFVIYCGKYSLQLYLFSFLYPIIRMLPTYVFHNENPFFIIPFVYIMQLLCAISIIEVTRRIKFLKIPCGY